jgi:hypothetical protein
VALRSVSCDPSKCISSTKGPSWWRAACAAKRSPRALRLCAGHAASVRSAAKSSRADRSFCAQICFTNPVSMGTWRMPKHLAPAHLAVRSLIWCLGAFSSALLTRRGALSFVSQDVELAQHHSCSLHAGQGCHFRCAQHARGGCRSCSCREPRCCSVHSRERQRSCHAVPWRRHSLIFHAASTV